MLKPSGTYSKLEPKNTKCTFVGYNVDSKAYWLIGVVTGILILSWDVIFDETIPSEMRLTRCIRDWRDSGSAKSSRGLQGSSWCSIVSSCMCCCQQMAKTGNRAKKWNAKFNTTSTYVCASIEMRSKAKLKPYLGLQKKLQNNTLNGTIVWVHV